jgi:hypothetical protein
VEERARKGPTQEAVRLRPPSGHTRYLINAQRDPCGYCGTGTRTTSVWATARGKGELVAWCGHCFNATCEPVALDEEHRQQFQAVRTAVSEGNVSPPWKAARPALEDLERRGLL